MTNPLSNVTFWLLYHALPYLLKHVIRIVTILTLRLTDKLPLKDSVLAIFEFFLREVPKLLPLSSGVPPQTDLSPVE